jgi:hypothetical protein
MKKFRILCLFALVVFLMTFSCKKKSTLESYQETLQLFKNPSADFSTSPFWVWNDKVTHEKIDSQLVSYRDIGIRQVIIHPRPGLITPYLTAEWFALVNYAVEKAKSMGMKIWLYDENSYPSGFAGGNVPARMPEARSIMLQRIETLNPDTLKLKIICKFQKTRDKYVLIDSSSQVKSEIPFIVFAELPAPSSAWFGGFSYVDIMQKKVTQQFLDLTIGGYAVGLKNEFGNTVSGIFSDEPNISGVWGPNLIPYTPALFESFNKKYGYDLRASLPALFEETGNWRKVRHDFYSVLLDLFIDNWAVPYSEYCAKNNLLMTGHYWDHDWPRPTGVPDNMALEAYSQVPGIDVLMNNWYGGFSGQFGNNRMVRELGSLANQLGKKRRLSETYGASGWDLTFKDMKRIGDWEFALGVNLMNQHLSYMTIAGARKRDHPLSFSWIDPWWQDYRIMNDYFSRMSVALSSGQQVNKVLVLEPTTTAWMYFQANWAPDGSKENSWKEGNFGSLISSFHSFIDSLENWQIEYDLGCEDIIRKHARVESNKLVVGSREYSLIILPSSMENLDSYTLNLLDKYLRNGGIILSTTKLPAYIEGQASGKVMDLASNFSKKWTQVNEIRELDITRLIDQQFHFHVRQSNGMVFHQRRNYSDFELVFIVNSSDKLDALGSLSMNGESVEKWDPFTGDVSPFPFKSNDNHINLDVHIPPAGSLLLAVKNEKRESVSAYHSKPTRIAFKDDVRIDRLQPNILTIDYCDLLVKNQEFKEVYFYQANKEAFRAYGFDRDPWDNAVQYQSTIIQRDTFSANSGFNANYFLTIEKNTSLENLKLVAERPGIFKISVNGKSLEPLSGKTWIDKEFAMYSLDSVLKIGRNCISLSCQPMSIYAEVEPIYILGNFSLKPQNKGFSLLPEKKLLLGSWNQQGMPMYYDKVSYSHIFIVENVLGKYILTLGRWDGTCTEIIVNGHKAGIVAFPPYQMNITSCIKQGENSVQVIANGTLRNTLGPHHQGSKGSAWPGMFQSIEKGRSLAGDSYITFPYGLYDDYTIINEQ